MKNYSLNSGLMQAEFDAVRGTITNLQLKKDPLQTNFIGNRENTSYPAIHKINQWTGDLRFRVWDADMADWREELTSVSDDIRVIKEVPKHDALEIFYCGRSRIDKGLNMVNARIVFKLEKEELHWYVSLKNTTDGILEIGEFSLPFLANADFTGIFEDPEYQGEERWRGRKQKLWHEQRVQQFLSIDGSSSYVFLQRPKGDYPAVLFRILDSDGIEEAYQIVKNVGLQWECTFEGPYYLSLYSKAAKACERWRNETEQQTFGLNGNHSLLLEKGEERQFHFVFHLIESHRQMKDYIYQGGGLDIDVHPGMVSPVDSEVRVRLRSKYEPRVVPAANNMRIEETGRDKDVYFYKMIFTRTGQKLIRVYHGGGLTTLAFYAIDKIEKLLDAHAEFIVDRQYYDNPLDPYQRHHAFLPYDNALEMIFTESTEAWQVGALDEYALPIAMYLAEKNAIRPDERQIAVMEEYIDTCLYKILQQKETYYARRGMYYVKNPTPSDQYNGTAWDKETAESILRSFNYPLITDIYYAMYKIAAKYGMTKVRCKEEYLEMAYRTSMVGYELGKNKFNGAPAGATVICLLEALKAEKPEWYEALNQKVEHIVDENVNSEYPFGSELYVDQTSHNQYEAMMRYYHKEGKYEEAYRVTYALRNGWQPQWFNYGNEKRGNVCCWYGTPLNTRVLYNGYEYSGNMELLKMGLAGALCFLTTIRSSGAATGWYLSWPDRSGFDSRSLDTDMGMYGYLYSAKAFVAEDEVFGLCGYGCDLSVEEGRKIIRPADGLGVRFRSVADGFDLEFNQGCYREIAIDARRRIIEVKTEPAGGGWRFEIAAEEGWTIYTDGNKPMMTAGKKVRIEGQNNDKERFYTN